MNACPQEPIAQTIPTTEPTNSQPDGEATLSLLTCNIRHSRFRIAEVRATTDNFSRMAEAVANSSSTGEITFNAENLDMMFSQITDALGEVFDYLDVLNTSVAKLTH